MLKSLFGVAVLAAVVGISGCATRAETVGTAGDAAVGYGLSGGSALGTAAGVVVGRSGQGVRPAQQALTGTLRSFSDSGAQGRNRTGTAG